MVPSFIQYVSLAGVSIELNEAVSPNYPLKAFNMQTYQEGQPQSKMQAPGEWPTYSYPRYRTFALTGDVLGDDPTDYNTLAGNLRAALQPPYRFYDVRRHGRLNLQFFGDGTTYWADVQLVSLELPKEANYPSVGEYIINWRSFEPYLRSGGGVGTVSLRY